MKTLLLELYKEKRTGTAAALLAAGVLGAAYAWANFFVRGSSLLALPLPPMDILLTQLYGMLMILNLFSLVVAACLVYNLEFRGGALKKLYALPVSVPAFYLCKFFILAVLLLAAAALQNLALALIGLRQLAPGAFELCTLLRFALYAYVTSLPVLAFMLLTASRFDTLWVPLGVGVAGFLSGMALATSPCPAFLLHPFIVMLKPAVAMSAQPDPAVAAVALAETALFLFAGLWSAKHLSCE